MGIIHGSTQVSVSYSVKITDTPYIKNETTNQVTEGTPVVKTEDRSASMAVASLIQLLQNSFNIESANGVYDTSVLAPGYALQGEYSNTSEKRHEVALATALRIKDSMCGGYTNINSICTSIVSTWKTIICQGGRRGTFTLDTKLPVFRSGEVEVGSIDAGSVVLCDDNGELSLSVVLLTKSPTDSSTACDIKTASGTYDAGGFSLSCA